MPRKVIDFSKLVIYKIVCNDLNIRDLYVGSTTGFKERKSKHKSVCNNPDSQNYHLKVYQFIRNNGGWDNWSMIMIERYPDCIDNNDRDKRERYWIEQLNATLNKQMPGRSIQEYHQNNKDVIATWQKTKHACDCGGSFTNINKSTHLKTKKHQNYLKKLEAEKLDEQTMKSIQMIKLHHADIIKHIDHRINKFNQWLQQHKKLKLV